MLERINAPSSQVWSVPTLEHLSVSNDLNGLLKAFLLDCRVDELSPRTLCDYREKIGRFVSFCYHLGTMDPAQVTVNHVRLFLADAQQRCNPCSVKDYFGRIKRFFNWMVSEEILDRNPMSNMRPPRVPRKIIKPFTPDHIKRFLILLDDGAFRGIRNTAIVLVFLDTGLRLSELADIQLQDFDYQRGVIRVMGKGAKERFVAVGKRDHKYLLKYLLMRKDGLPCLWVTGEGEPLKWRGIQIMIKRLAKRAGITGVRCSPHTFRHTFATQSLLNGAGEFGVSQVGHSDLRMTRHYASSLNSEQAIEAHKKFSPVDNMKL